jgi:hypothetical protein
MPMCALRYCLLAGVLLAGHAHALMPADEIARINLDSELIVVGRISEIGSIILPEQPARLGAQALFVMRVLHVIKGHGRVAPGELVRFASLRLPDGPYDGIAGALAASLAVSAVPGDVVVAYLSPSSLAGFWQPSVGGASVVVIQTASAKPAPK